MRTLKLIMIVLTLVINACTNKDTVYSQANYTTQLPWIKFEWEGDSIGNRFFDKVAMLIPTTIENLPYKFFTQFDLGASHTMIYEVPFTPYLSKYPELAYKLDTTKRDKKINGNFYGGFKNISIQLDSVKIPISNITYYEDFGEAIEPEGVGKAPLEIGTIGIDVCRNKFLIIDYPNQRLALLDTLPESLIGTEFVHCKKNSSGGILVPFVIADNSYHGLFDTGSSMFSFISTSDFWDDHCYGAKADTLLVSSWGEDIEIHGAPMRNDVYIGTKKLPLSACYKASVWDSFFENEQIAGVMGNKWFLQHIVIIDFKQYRFGIARGED